MKMSQYNIQAAKLPEDAIEDIVKFSGVRTEHNKLFVRLFVTASIRRRSTYFTVYSPTVRHSLSWFSDTHPDNPNFQFLVGGGDHPFTWLRSSEFISARQLNPQLWHHDLPDGWAYPSKMSRNIQPIYTLGSSKNRRVVEQYMSDFDYTQAGLENE